MEQEKNAFGDTEKKKKRGPIGGKKKPARKKKRTSQGKMQKKPVLLIAGIAAALVLLAGGAAIYFLTRGQADTKEEIPEVEITQITQEEAPLKEEEKIGQDVLQHIVTAGQAVMQSYQKRPF